MTQNETIKTFTSDCWCHMEHLQDVVWLAVLLYDVIIRGAMLIDINSWKRSLQAYGIRTREIWRTDKQMVIDHVCLCLVVVSYWWSLPASCCGSLDTRMCVCVCWRWPSVHTGYRHELDMDQMLQTDVLSGTVLLHERFDSHAPSHRTADHHHWQTDTWVSQVSQTGNTDR